MVSTSSSAEAGRSCGPPAQQRDLRKEPEKLLMAFGTGASSA